MITAVEGFHKESNAMFKRRSVMAGGLAMATTSSLAPIAMAQAGRPTMVFIGHEL